MYLYNIQKTLATTKKPQQPSVNTQKTLETI